MRQKFNPGEAVWIVERNEEGDAFDVTGFLFLAEVADTAIVTPKVTGCYTLEDIMAYHSQETALGGDASFLAVFPTKDCYLYRCEAEDVLARETED